MELIRQSKRDEIVSGVYTETNIVLSDNGLLAGTVHTWTRNKFKGAHAQASVVALNSDRAVLWTMSPVRCGVAGRWDPTGSSDRTVPFSTQIPLEVLPKVTYLAIVNNYRDESAFLNFVEAHKEDLAKAGIYILTTLVRAESTSDSTIIPPAA